jgi:hypothetical protein
MMDICSWRPDRSKRQERSKHFSATNEWLSVGTITDEGFVKGGTHGDRGCYSPPPVNGDFYKIADVLNPKERAVVKRVRDFMEAEVAPIIEDYWGRDQFPHEIIPKLRALDIKWCGACSSCERGQDANAVTREKLPIVLG